VKPVRFLAGTLKNIRSFPDKARSDAGHQLRNLQRGSQPDDFKPMPDIGRGVEEIRVWDEMGTFRVVYTARLVEAVYVLHAFQKKTQTTSQHDIELARTRFGDLMRSRK
jgi:phage-related protein